ncbi:F-box/kelch-repeat protein At1g57790-like [Macadamia integrifolia]|uniref:F-box/kelch-repeat protein At1g57790-like n=1 Tax=Macadamia integrifolia TaxID=60698 RepID=UPI001C4F57B4|nr:F-box/kelch-repeat protein At1g57790-like [Macadamia integrifolia]XP_042483882.1 F-box/kelch-repeat protein At1g57790-like [Macadamia integrifolia]
MTGKRRTRRTENPVKVDELRPWSELPTDLLRLIVSRLCLKDNVRLSCVCKKLGKVARKLRVVNQSPWLMFTPALGGILKFFDPSQGKFYVDEIPELCLTEIKCSKDGWVLISGRALFLFNPFTLSVVDLPYYSVHSSTFALSCAPTSPDSVVFAIQTHLAFNQGLDTQEVSIGICHPGDSQWSTFKFQIPGDCYFYNWGDGPVFCNGLFYCLSKYSYNFLGVFDPQKHTWSILDVPPPNLPPMIYYDKRAKHMVEFKGELLLVCVSYPDKPIIFKLDLSKMKWVEMQSLNDVTVFVSSHSSLAVTNVPRISSNSVYFSKRRNYGKNIYLYSLNDCKYHPAMQQHEGPFFHNALWIKPPKKSHLLFDELY